MVEMVWLVNGYDCKTKYFSDSHQYHLEAIFSNNAAWSLLRNGKENIRVVIKFGKSMLQH